MKVHLIVGVEAAVQPGKVIREVQDTDVGVVYGLVEAAVEPEVQAVDGVMGSMEVLGVTEYQSI